MDFTADTILPRVNHTLKDTKETRRKIYKGKWTFWTKKRMAFGEKCMWKTLYGSRGVVCIPCLEEGRRIGKGDETQVFPISILFQPVLLFSHFHFLLLYLVHFRFFTYIPSFQFFGALFSIVMEKLHYKLCRAHCAKYHFYCWELKASAIFTKPLQ